jgi:hypothetical protein
MGKKSDPKSKSKPTEADKAKAKIKAKARKARKGPLRLAGGIRRLWRDDPEFAPLRQAGFALHTSFVSLAEAFARDGFLRTIHLKAQDMTQAAKKDTLQHGNLALAIQSVLTMDSPTGKDLLTFAEARREQYHASETGAQ